MSFRRNIIASYASQVYVTLIAVVMVPFYLKYMGTEAYGLIGFFAVLQAWFQLLDMGMAPTMGREAARFQGGSTDALHLRRFLRALEEIFCGTAIFGVILLTSGSSWVANSWLNLQQLSLVEAERAVVLMALVIALRWICGLYRGALNGLERLVWLSGFNAAIATVRFVMVVPFFIYVGASPAHFFMFQLVVALIELFALAAQTYRILPKLNREQLSSSTWNWRPLKGSLGFSLSVAFTSSIWVLVTQTDKLILSKLLPLMEYAYFSLAVLVAGGVLLATGPVSAALIPRMTRLNAEGNHAGLVRLYRDSTQLVAAIAIPTSIVLALFAEQILWVWTGSVDISQHASPVLTLYALGNGVLALGAFPAYLQFAKGDLRLHVVGNAYFILLLLPMLVWATWQFGMRGAGYAWLCANVAYFLIWVPKVHDRFLKNFHLSWLFQDVGGVLMCGLCVAGFGYIIREGGGMGWPSDRVAMAMRIAALGTLTVAVSSLGSPWIRSIALRALTRRQYV